LNRNLIEVEFRQQADVVVEGVEAGEQVASTVVDTTTQPLTILREGPIASQKIKQIFGA
jgi:tRNA A37 threonylcarbamoyladenosine synthetase subunit TsaC/SUA5/YrdC